MRKENNTQIFSTLVGRLLSGNISHTVTSTNSAETFSVHQLTLPTCFAFSLNSFSTKEMQTLFPLCTATTALCWSWLAIAGLKEMDIKLTLVCLFELAALSKT